MGHPIPQVTANVFAVSPATGRLEGPWPYGNRPGIFAGPARQGQQASAAFSTASSTDLSKILRALSFSGGTVGANVNTVDRAGSCTYTSAFLEGSDTTSMALNSTAGSTSFGYSIDLSSGEWARRGDTLWFSVRMFRPIGYVNFGSSHVKFFRFHVLTAASGHVGYNDVYLSQSNEQTGASTPNGSQNFIWEGAQNWENFDATTTTSFGVWETWDYAVTFDTVAAASGGSALIRMWKNKVLLKTITDRATLTNTTDTVQEAHHTTYWNGGAPATQSLGVRLACVAGKIAGVRDDTQWMTTDSGGNFLVAAGL